MDKRDQRDILGGLVLVVVGLGMGVYASLNYDIGTLRRMGPGMFPMGVGYLLAFLGALSILPTLLGQVDRERIQPAIKWAPAGVILVSVVSFALLIRPFGLIPAIVATTLFASQAEHGNRLRSIIGLCATLVALSYVLFIHALGLPMRIVNWPL